LFGRGIANLNDIGWKEGRPGYWGIQDDTQTGGSQTNVWIDDPSRVNYDFYNKLTNEAIDPMRIGAYDIPDKGTYFFNLTPGGFETWFNPRSRGYAPAIASFLSMTPLFPVAAGYNAYKAIDSGDVIGGLANIAAMGGMSGLSNELKVVNAIKQGNAGDALSALGQMVLPDTLGETKIGDFTLSDIAKGASIVSNISSDNYIGALQAAGELAGSQNTVMAAKGASLLQALNSGNPAEIANAAASLGQTINGVAPGSIKTSAPIVERNAAPVVSGATTGDAGADAILAASQGVGQELGGGTQVAGTDLSFAGTPAPDLDPRDRLTAAQIAQGYYYDEEGQPRTEDGGLIINVRGSESDESEDGSGTGGQGTRVDDDPKLRQLIATAGVNAAGTELANTGSPAAKLSSLLGSTHGAIKGPEDFPPGFFVGTVFDSPEQQNEFLIYFENALKNVPEDQKQKVQNQLDEIKSAKVIEQQPVNPATTPSVLTNTQTPAPVDTTKTTTSSTSGAPASLSDSSSSSTSDSTPSGGESAGAGASEAAATNVATQVESSAANYVNGGYSPADAWTKALADNGLKEGELIRPAWAVPGGELVGGKTTVSTQGSTTGSTQGSTTGSTQGSTDGSTAGSTTGSTQGGSTGATSGTGTETGTGTQGPGTEGPETGGPGTEGPGTGTETKTETGTKTDTDTGDDSNKSKNKTRITTVTPVSETPTPSTTPAEEKSSIYKVGDLGKYVSPLIAYQMAVQDMYNKAMDEKARQERPKETNLESDTSFWSYGQERPVESFFGVFDNFFGSKEGNKPTEVKAATGGSIAALLAAGGASRTGRGSTTLVPHSGKMRVDFRRGDAVTGPGDGQSDDIPAMLADGEFVFPADVVSALGNGSTKAGSDKLYEMMHAIRARARKAHPKSLPPPAKSPLEYLRGKK
jgi:hypothetical protein